VVAYQQVDHPDRLRYPMIRRGGKAGQLERATWDEAMDYIVSRWKQIQVEHGNDAVAVYSGSSMTNEKCYVMGKFARVALRSRNIDYNGRLCMSSSAVAYARSSSTAWWTRCISKNAPTAGRRCVRRLSHLPPRRPNGSPVCRLSESWLPRAFTVAPQPPLSCMAKVLSTAPMVWIPAWPASISHWHVASWANLAAVP